MHEGFAEIIDTPETREAGLAGKRGRARGMRVGPHIQSTTQFSWGPKQFADIPCDWVRNTCYCWPASSARCDACKNI